MFKKLTSKSVEIGCSALCLFFAALVFYGCAHLTPGANALVVRVEQAETAGLETFKLLEAVDNSNRGFWKTNAPAFHALAEWLRAPQPVDGGALTLPRSLAIIKQLDNIKVDYQKSLTTSNSLASALIVFQSTVAQTAIWLPVITNSIPNH